MAYIVMARGEDGTEFRPSELDHGDDTLATQELSRLRHDYPCAKLWVEELRDMSYYMQQHQQHWDDDTYDLY